MTDSPNPGILVVDDNAENRLLLTEYLADLGLPVYEAVNGEHCLEMLRASQYTLVIMDIQMPGLNGFEVLEIMRKDKRLSEVPVMFVSTVYDSDQFILKGITGGAIDFITKPVNIHILKSKVSNFIKLYEKQAKLDQTNTKLALANQRLKANKRKLKGITESASDSIILLDHNYKISFWNKSSIEIFGYAKYEILTENFFEKLIAQNSRNFLIDKFNSLVNSSDRILADSVRLGGLKKQGIEFPIEISLSYFYAKDNQVKYTVIIRDITHRVSIEKEALKAKELRETNKMMKEFMDNVSHELRTPMNAIIGISNMLMKYNAGNLLSKQVEGLQIIYQSGTRLLDLINDILDLSKLDSGKVTVTKEEFDLEKMLASLRSIVISLIDKKNIRFSILKSPQVPVLITSDSKKLNQILLNLLGNAVKFTEKGKIHLFIHLKEEKLIFEVTDTGIGISEVNQSVIFERFRQIDNSESKEYQGTGLGLNISKSYVELLGGNMTVESTPGKGTTMRFYIPLENVIHIKDDHKPGLLMRTYEQIMDNLNIDLPLALVIDDNEQNNYWYSSLLKEFGYEVLSCLNSSEGFIAIKQYLPDLVLLKFEMPKIHGKFIIHQFVELDVIKTIHFIITTSIENLHLQNITNIYSVINEPVSGKELIRLLEKINTLVKTNQITEQLFLFEQINHFKGIAKPESIFQSSSLPAAIMMIVRRKINNLILDGFTEDGVHRNLINWISQNSAKAPDKTILVVNSYKEKVTLEKQHKGWLKESVELLEIDEAIIRFKKIQK